MDYNTSEELKDLRKEMVRLMLRNQLREHGVTKQHADHISYIITQGEYPYDDDSGYYDELTTNSMYLCPCKDRENAGISIIDNTIIFPDGSRLID